MGTVFVKLKNKAFIIRLLKSVMMGIFISGVTIGALILLSKLEIWEHGLTVRIIIGVGTLIVSGVGTYALLRISDMHLAKELDKKYGLNEKVQTMLVFKEEDGALVQLQRRDADEALDSVKNVKIGIKTIWIYIVCFLLGIGAFLLASWYQPAKEPPPPALEIPFTVDELDILSLNELVTFVNESKMESPFKENIAQSISTLIDELKLCNTVRQRNAALDKAIDEIFFQTDESSCALELMNELWATTNQGNKLLAKALNYYEWPRADEWDKFLEEAEKLRAAFIYITDAPKIMPDGDGMSEEEASAALEFLKAILPSMSNGAIASLEKSQLSPEDELYIAVLRLIKANEINQDLGTHVYGIEQIYKLCDGLGYQDAQRELDATFTALNSVIFNALEHHSINTSTGEQVLSKISALFDYKIDPFERPQLFDFDFGEGGGPTGEGGGGGGIGNGTVYGSDDLVYDPLSKKYVEYGVILDKYYKLMFEKANGEGYTEEEKQAMEKYFQILYGGFTEEPSEND